MNHFRRPSNRNIMEENLDITKPCYNELIWAVSWSFVKSRFHCNRCKEWMACGAFLIRAHISRVVIIYFRYSHYSGILTSHSQF